MQRMLIWSRKCAYFDICYCCTELLSHESHVGIALILLHCLLVVWHVCSQGVEVVKCVSLEALNMWYLWFREIRLMRQRKFYNQIPNFVTSFLISLSQHMVKRNRDVAFESCANIMAKRNTCTCPYVILHVACTVGF